MEEIEGLEACRDPHCTESPRPHLDHLRAITITAQTVELCARYVYREERAWAHAVDIGGEG